MNLKKKYVWLPALLAIYFIVMAVYFGRDLLAAGRIWQFVATAVAETAVLVGLFFALRWRDRNSRR